MNMKFLNPFVYVPLVGLLTLASCAKEQSESYNRYEEQALEAWIHQKRPDLIGNKQEPGGYYVDVLYAGDPDAEPLGEQEDWVRFGFTGRDLSGNIILTRSASDAVLEGTFTKYTRYVPFYRYCGEQNTNLLEGTYLAMRNTLTLSETYFEKYRNDPERALTSREVKMRYGSRVRLYMPSSVVGGGGVEGSGGYEGQYSLDARRPMIVELEIRDTVRNPLEREGSDVDEFCERNGGLKIYSKEAAEKSGKDSSIPSDPSDPDHPYNVSADWVSACDTIPQLYVDYRYTPGDTFDFEHPYHAGYEPYKNAGSVADIDRQIVAALKERFYPDGEEYPGVKELKADSVKLDGKAKIWYIGRFLDGFIFDTNIDEVKKIIYGEVKSVGEALEYTPSKGNLIKAFYYVVPNLQFGQWASLITTSTNAYGSSGKSGTSSTSTSGGSSNSGYLDYINYMNYMNSYYGSNGYYGGYYNNYYGNYYNGYYGGYGSSSDTSDNTTTTKSVSTEVPPFAPLIFQFYIEPAK